MATSSSKSMSPARTRRTGTLSTAVALLAFGLIASLKVNVYLAVVLTRATSLELPSDAAHLMVPPPPRAMDTKRMRAINTKRKQVGASTATGSAHITGGERLDTEIRTTVAYAVSVTGCGKRSNVDGAAVLGHSIHQASARGAGSPSKYDYKLFAIYHPNAEHCAKPLEALGYELLKRDVFVNVSDIRGEYLRSRIESDGCCGEKELIKLECYTLTDYPIVVHLDMDALVLKPMDEIFDVMMRRGSVSRSLSAAMWTNITLPTNVNAFFTYDYNVVRPSKTSKPVQGGFIVIRPDRKVYETFREIVLEGDFREKSGWGGSVGPFHGSMTFQGIVSYYYNFVAPGEAVELNRCIYNQMCDNPRDKRTVNDVAVGRCRSGETNCEDCRLRPLEDVVTSHFTAICGKPWWCQAHSEDRIQSRLCRKLHHEWFRIRSDLERTWGRPAYGPSEWERDQFFGFCTPTKKAHHHYEEINPPYGPSSSASI